MKRLLLAALLALSVAATAQAGFGAKFPQGPDPVAAQWGHWPYPTACGGLPFDPIASFNGPTVAENGSGAPEAALRAFLDAGVYPEVPDRFWRLVALSDTRAEFASGRLELDLYWLVFEKADGRWAWKTSGTCRPHSLRDGERAARWTLDDASDLRPSSRRIAVDISEPGCTGGANPNPRVEEPGLDYRGGRLVVTLWVTPLPPGPRTCEARIHPPYMLRLPRPLGDRGILNGSAFPPREVLSRGAVARAGR